MVLVVCCLLAVVVCLVVSGNSPTEDQKYSDGFQYAKRQIQESAGDPTVVSRLEDEAFGWEDNHPFDRGMRDALSELTTVSEDR